jgi:hypothetical protein
MPVPVHDLVPAAAALAAAGFGVMEAWRAGRFRAESESLRSALGFMPPHGTVYIGVESMRVTAVQFTEGRRVTVRAARRGPQPAVQGLARVVTASGREAWRGTSEYVLAALSAGQAEEVELTWALP